MGLWYIWRIGYDNRATCHEVRALRQGVFSNLLKPPSRLNIQVLTESRTYLPPSDGPVKDCCRIASPRSPSNSAASSSARCHSTREPCRGAPPQSLGRPLKTKGARAASLREPLSWDPVLSASVSRPGSRRCVEDLTESLPRLCFIVNSSSSLQFAT